MADSSEQNNKTVLSKTIEENIKIIKSIFENDQTLIVRKVQNPEEPYPEFCVIYVDGMVNNIIVNEDVIKPLIKYKPDRMEKTTIDLIANQVTFSNSVDKTSDIDTIIQGIVYGDTILLIDGYAEALILNTKGWVTRSISEPDGEKVLKGPREGFNESILMNLSLVRRKIRTPDLKMEFKTFGTRTNTKACICYLDSLVDKKVLNELKKRLDSFTIDGTLDSNYLCEFIKDSPCSPIKTIGSTERPDVVAGKLLEGRIALFLDGSPVVLTLPFLFIEYFQSDEDYYLNYFFTSIGRILRIVAFFITTSLPAIYVSLVTFHQEMLPTPLLVSISAARKGVPFPTSLEMILMLVAFEMLRESGARMPGMMGQTLSIVGALVIGQAAVEAKIFSAPIIIIVAFTGITGLMVPRSKSIDIILRFVLIFLSSLLGLYGYMFGILAFLIHVLQIESFGVAIMNSAYADTLQDSKDIFIRAPWWMMKKRPKYLSQNEVRENVRSKK
jgi:spore germination protein KA